MGIFNFFKKYPVIVDDCFGELKRFDSRNSNSYFTGRGMFAPLGKEIEYLINATGAAPTVWQKEFYKNLQSDFNLYVEKIKPLIEEEFRNWKDDFVINDFMKEFELEHISIPGSDETPLSWDMSFTSIHDLNHTFTIDFSDYEPNGVLIDG